jgi:uncharacterized protein (DUF302 family)
MATTKLAVERFKVVSARSFDEVLAGLAKGIGRPDMRVLHRQIGEANSMVELQKLIDGVVGNADLMEFLRLDLGDVMRKDPGAKAYRIVRIIAGNPLIMKKMVELVPDAGSYAPVTVLVYEAQDGVYLAYDTMSSYLASYGNDAALEVARELDRKVIKLLNEAAA